MAALTPPSSALGVLLVEHIGDRQAVEHEAGVVEVASLVVSDQGFSGMGGNGHGELQKKMVGNQAAACADAEELSTVLGGEAVKRWM
ncbi:hypothetical protein LP415_00235 [Polaromonas sp. P1(28)-8]|nr:hypothetical protein LP415_00235 [Polaromonas sp. P1(28)-8]